MVVNSEDHVANGPEFMKQPTKVKKVIGREDVQLHPDHACKPGVLGKKNMGLVPVQPCNDVESLDAAVFDLDVGLAVISRIRDE